MQGLGKRPRDLLGCKKPRNSKKPCLVNSIHFLTVYNVKLDKPADSDVIVDISNLIFAK
jgi:hypothetical protein